MSARAAWEAREQVEGELRRQRIAAAVEEAITPAPSPGQREADAWHQAAEPSGVMLGCCEEAREGLSVWALELSYMFGECIFCGVEMPVVSLQGPEESENA